MALRFIWFVALAFALVATGTFAAGEGEEAAAAEKEYVTDPSTGKQVLKPAYGGTITAALLTLPFDHADTWVSHAGGVFGGAALDKLGQADWAVDRSINKLVTYYPESVVTGHLAESWENPDPLTYIYKLRDNVFFHDKPPVNGRQLTADDMAANYERLFAIGRFAGQEPAVHTWGTKGLPFESVTATDELTLQIKLSRPNADTHRQLFDDCHVRAYPPETFDMLGNVNNLIGTGPFIVNEYVSGSSITWDRNPDYWKDDEKYPGNRLPYADKLVMLMMSDEATRLAALRSGQIDITGETGVSRIKSIANAVQLQEDVAGIQLFPIALRSETSLSMRMDKPPLNDIRVRHALQMALDLETVRDNYFLGFGDWQPMGSVGPAVTGYNNPFDTWPEELKKFWSYDPAGAERLLDEAGYPRGADGVRFETSIMTNGDRGDVGYMELVAGYWKEIGVEVEIETPDNATYEGRRQSLDFDGFVDFWAVGADYGNVASTLGQFRDDASYKAGTFSDPVFEAKYDELEAAAGDAEEYRRLAKALDMYVIEQHPYIYGPRVATFNVAQPWIVGYNGEMAIGNCAWNGPYARMWIDSQLKAELN
ncbi:MAG: ABC transporter substrate-binding protein [Spirochaetaceae bacterium]|nr:ABC transporter substrate-binding protein [Spirochaetaceae bacterium]